MRVHRGHRERGWSLVLLMPLVIFLAALGALLYMLGEAENARTSHVRQRGKKNDAEQ